MVFSTIRQQLLGIDVVRQVLGDGEKLIVYLDDLRHRETCLKRLFCSTENVSIEWRGPVHVPQQDAHLIVEQMPTKQLEQRLLNFPGPEPPQDWLEEMMLRISRDDRARLGKLFKMSRSECEPLLETSDALGVKLRKWRPKGFYCPEQLGVFTQTVDLALAARFGAKRLLKHFVGLFKYNNTRPLWSENTSCWAARNGDCKLLQFLVDNGCPLSSACMSSAAYEGNIEALEFLHRRRVPWESEVLMSACSTNTARHQACALYAIDHGCPWDPEVSYRAGMLGMLPILQRIQASHQSGYVGEKLEWHENTLSVAVKSGRLDCVKFGHGCGYTWGCGALKDYPGEIISDSERECRVYARLHDAPQGYDKPNPKCTTCQKQVSGYLYNICFLPHVLCNIIVGF